MSTLLWSENKTLWSLKIRRRGTLLFHNFRLENCEREIDSVHILFNHIAGVLSFLASIVFNGEGGFKGGSAAPHPL